MKQYRLEGEHFLLTLEVKVFESDVRYSSNTLMTVTVDSFGFCGSSIFDIDVKQFGRFVRELGQIYQTLSGAAEIREPWGEQFLAFEGNGRGHISVEGLVCPAGLHGFTQQLRFENMVDQTCLREFAAELRADFERYAK